MTLPIAIYKPFVRRQLLSRATAVEYVRVSPKRIILIDGADLTRLMAEHDVGARTISLRSVKRLDEDYFEM